MEFTGEMRIKVSLAKGITALAEESLMMERECVHACVYGKH